MLQIMSSCSRPCCRSCATRCATSALPQWPSPSSRRLTSRRPSATTTCDAHLAPQAALATPSARCSLDLKRTKVSDKSGARAAATPLGLRKLNETAESVEGTCPRARTSSSLFMPHSSCRTASSSAPTRAAHAGLRASNLGVLSAPLPTSDPSGVQRKGPEGRKYYPSDRQAVAAPSALLPAKRSGATCVRSSPFFKPPKPGGKIKTQKKPKEFRTRTADFCEERQDKQTRRSRFKSRIIGWQCAHRPGVAPHQALACNSLGYHASACNTVGIPGDMDRGTVWIERCGLPNTRRRRMSLV